MNVKLKVLLSILALLTAYAAGRWASPVKTVTKTVTVEVEKKTTDTNTDADSHTKTTIVETDKPDGTKTKTTTITDDTGTKTETKSQDQTSTTESQSKETTYSQSKVTISALAATGLLNGSPTLTYGGAITKPVLGPITVGGFFFTNGVIGASLGLTL